MSLDPQWSDRLSKTGRPEQPLRADSVTIQMEQAIARGITTDVRARGRYFSGFCWAMHRVNHSSATRDYSNAEKRNLLAGFEEILGLASYRRQQTQQENEDGLSGVTGRTNISDDALYDAETIDLSSFSLLDNSPYAIRRFQSTLGHFYLKEGQFALTAAGREIAEGLDEIVGPYFDSMIAAVENNEVPLTLLDELADAFTHQGCFTSTENDAERAALQRMLFGLVSWDERGKTVELMDWPRRVDIPISDHYQYVVSEEHYTDDLQDSVASGIHYLRRAWCLSILRTYHLIASDDKASEFAYDERDRERFRPARPLLRLYFLQVQLAHALRAMLWGLAAHLEREAPEGVPKRRLLDQLESTRIAAEATAACQAETTLLDGQLNAAEITRELVMTGRVAPSSYEITVPDSTDRRLETLGDIQTWCRSNLGGEWRPTTDAEVNGWTLLEATEAARGSVENASTQSEAIDALGRLLGRSTIQLVGAIEQYRQVIADDELLDRYVEQRFGRRHSSLVRTAQYLVGLDSEITLSTLARRLLDERVIAVHDYVIQDRLGSGSISLVFGTGADADESDTDDSVLFAAGGTASPGKGTLRHRDLRRLMRDAGLLQYRSETGQWIPTADGETVLARFRGEYE